MSLLKQRFKTSWNLAIKKIEQKLDEVHEQIGFHCEKIENQP